LTNFPKGGHIDIEVHKYYQREHDQIDDINNCILHPLLSDSKRGQV
jgi:hypothetical protein